MKDLERFLHLLNLGEITLYDCYKDNHNKDIHIKITKTDLIQVDIKIEEKRSRLLFRSIYVLDDLKLINEIKSFDLSRLSVSFISSQESYKYIGIEEIESDYIVKVLNVSSNHEYVDDEISKEKKIVYPKSDYNVYRSSYYSLAFLIKVDHE